MSNRFSVALSFPGEDREFVQQVAQALAHALTRERVFYDTWYEAELLGTGGDLKLQAMYKQADLVVPFFSKHYEKPWCSVEWDVIREILLLRRKDDAVIPVHLDDTKVPGWSEVNFGIRLRGRSPKLIADVILQALAKRSPLGTTASSTRNAGPSSRVANTVSKLVAPSENTALSIWHEKLDYLRKQEAIESEAAAKFALKKRIEEAIQKIVEFGGKP
jgi:hypothetical protein